MPHVRRSMLITFDADPDRVRRALVDDLELTATDTGYAGPIQGMPDTTARLEAVVTARTPTATDVRLDAVSEVIVPFFTTFLVRTFAWKTIFNDGGVLVSVLGVPGHSNSNSRYLHLFVAGYFQLLPYYCYTQKQ